MSELIFYALLYILPYVVAPALGLAAIGWGGWKLKSAWRGRRWVTMIVGAASLVFGVLLIGSVIDYALHPFAPTD